MLLGSKGEKRRAMGQRWEEPDSQPSHTNFSADLLKIGLYPSRPRLAREHERVAQPEARTWQIAVKLVPIMQGTEL